MRKMTSGKSTATAGAQPRTPRSNRDSARWIGGLLLLCFGLIVGLALLSSFFCWENDQSVLRQTSEEAEVSHETVSNWCGGFGARLGWLLVDRSLGVCGILVPVMLILLGVRIIRQQPLHINRSILPLALVMILGSLTLGFAFGSWGSLCASTGWGGAFGIECAELLRSGIGVVGTIILLAGGWILTGVYINRNFINTVNTAGNAVLDRSERIVESVRRKVATPAVDEAALSAATETPVSVPAAAPIAPAPPVIPAAPVAPAVPTASAVSAGETSADWADVIPSREVPVSVSRMTDEVPREAAHEAAYEAPHGVSSHDEEDENPFLEITTGDEEPAAAEPEPGPAVVTDGVFTEVDLSRPSGRIVMGRGGLLELDASALQDAVRSVAAEEHAAAPAADGPFTELVVEQPAPAVSELSQPAGQLRPQFEPQFESQPEPLAEPLSDPMSAAAPDSLPDSQPEAAPAEGVVVTVEAHEAQLVDEEAIASEAYDPLKDLINYRKPAVTLLEDYQSDFQVSDEEIYENKSRIEETLKYFGIPIQRIKATVGPTVTLYEIVQAQGVKISKIQGLENDIAQSLKALGIRIIAPIPGKGTIGIEVPNRDKQVVSMYSAVRSMRFQESKAELPVVIGRTIQNENYVFDLAKMPHLLVAGATGQGKSVGLNAIITSLLYRKHPAQLKFVMIDPKMVEFSLYAKIERHFLAKMESEENSIVTDPMKAVYTLNSLCLEMDNRLKLCSEAGARNIIEYNEKFTSRRLNPNKGHRYLPYIVVVVDEFADLIMMAREVERPVMRLAQKARAIGIHLIIATQRPDVKVITGGIKANFPARIAFRVMQMIDSRTIIDQPGANQLIGRGDMLFSKDGELTRIQCALVETKEVERIVDYISTQPSYTEPYLLPDYAPEGGEGGGMGSEESSAPVKYDALFADIAREAVSSGSISTSMIQRNYEVGFNRAGRIMMQLERAGIVGRQQGAKPRDILFHDQPSLEAKLQELGVF